MEKSGKSEKLKLGSTYLVKGKIFLMVITYKDGISKCSDTMLVEEGVSEVISWYGFKFKLSVKYN